VLKRSPRWIPKHPIFPILFRDPTVHSTSGGKYTNPKSERAKSREFYHDSEENDVKEIGLVSARANESKAMLEQKIFYITDADLAKALNEYASL
jgi:hypothetical protein